MKYYLIAGERSGDLHGANLIRALKQQAPECEIRCWGGDMMKEAGGELVVHYRDTAFMGFLEVIKNLGTIRRFLTYCKKDIESWQPDAVVLIDYPGFNLRIAKFAKSIGIKTCYYISPKIWAWNQRRAKKIKKNVDKMFCILPFEKAFYRKFGFNVEYVGNPLVDSISSYDYDLDLIRQQRTPGKFAVGILPGSRMQEITSMLETMASIFPRYPDIRFYIAAVDNIPQSYYQRYQDYPNVTIFTNKAYDILKIVDAAIVTSGTATLETALFQVPQVVCYKTSAVSYAIAKMVIKVRFISLVNLIMDREVVKELIQKDFTTEKLQEFIDSVREECNVIATMRENYRELREIIGDESASEQTAKSILTFTGS